MPRTISGALVLALLLLGGCSREESVGDGNSASPMVKAEPLTVVAAYPTVEDGEVSVLDSVVVEFNNEIDPSSISDNSIKAYGQYGSVRVEGRKLIFRPTLAFDFAVAVEVVVSQDVTDIHGDDLGSDYKFLFYTEVEPGK